MAKVPSATVNELLVQMQINRSNAAAGGSGANVGASAIISVLATYNGAPVDNLAGPPGTNFGDQTSEISMPNGWELRDGFNVRPGGCVATVTEFGNQGGGIYDIRIVPYVRTPACTWLSGEYIYAVLIKVPVGNVIFQGGALGKLTIL